MKSEFTRSIEDWKKEINRLTEELRHAKPVIANGRVDINATETKEFFRLGKELQKARQELDKLL